MPTSNSKTRRRQRYGQDATTYPTRVHDPNRNVTVEDPYQGRTEVNVSAASSARLKVVGRAPVYEYERLGSMLTSREPLHRVTYWDNSGLQEGVASRRELIAEGIQVPQWPTAKFPRDDAP